MLLVTIQIPIGRYQDRHIIGHKDDQSNSCPSLGVVTSSLYKERLANSQNSLLIYDPTYIYHLLYHSQTLRSFEKHKLSNHFGIANRISLIPRDSIFWCNMCFRRKNKPYGIFLFYKVS